MNTKETLNGLALIDGVVADYSMGLHKGLSYEETEKYALAALQSAQELLSEVDQETKEHTPKYDVIKRPKHYNMGDRETIDIIKDITGDGFEGYLLGNIIKYLGRYKYKGGITDLGKAEWYLSKLIDLYSKGE